MVAVIGALPVPEGARQPPVRAGILRVLAQDRAFDQPVRAVGGVEDLIVVIVVAKAERAEVDREMAPVGQRQPHLGHLRPRRSTTSPIA
jgi:hypothetical protein